MVLPKFKSDWGKKEKRNSIREREYKTKDTKRDIDRALKRGKVSV